MAWGAKARNNSAKTRRVNYHENEGSGRGPQRDDEAWSKGAKIVAGGVVLFVLANTGLGPIIETAQNVMDVFDLGNDIKEYKASSQATDSKGSGKVKRGEDNYKSVKCKVDLEAADVADILDFFNTEFSASNVDTSDVKVNIIDYDAFKNDRKYNNNVIDELSKKSGTVTFMAVCPNYLTEEEMHAEFERIDKIVTENKEGIPNVFRQIKRNGGLNVPRTGSFVMAVTFVTD